jgi:iron(III) transport system substrate-binding protein
MRKVQILCVALLMTGVGIVAFPSGEPTPTLMVYSSRSHYGSEPVFEAFTRKTGIKVDFFMGNNNEVFERLRSEGARSPADLLLTVDAGNLWNAANAGLLAPVQSAVLDDQVPAHLRDAQGRWYGVAVRARTIMYSTARVAPSALSTYAALGEPRWKGRLCLRSSTNIYNQSLLGTLIKQQGEPAVEALVRGWVANNPIMVQDDTKLLEAIAANRCDVGITNTYYLARIKSKNPDFAVAPFWPDQQAGGVHVNVSGAGLTASSRNRTEAVALLEYLTSPDAQAILAAASFEYPVHPRVAPSPVLNVWGAFKPQTVGVASAGEFQAAAVRLADRAGYR